LLGEHLFRDAAKGTITIEEGFIDSDAFPSRQPSFFYRVDQITCERSYLDERTADDLSNVEDKDLLVAFLGRCLKLDPSNRASASELIDDPWLA
ncbi:hypothetical protein CPB84DRAFT_1776766, partial [Gymnopilus junonius]